MATRETASKARPAKSMLGVGVSVLQPEAEAPASEGARDVELELEVMEALRGAADLKDKLVLGFSAGAPSVSDLAYAVKVRVKEDHSMVAKVIDRRSEKPGYGVPNVRDTVGVRIVTLYRLDALQIVPLVLEMIESSPDAGPFKRSSLEEVRIYSTNPRGDAQSMVDKLQRIFTNWGHKSLVEVVSNANNYTSIHMVAWGFGKYQEAHRCVPIEIQIRTAFEDAWGEIEHKLKYKRQNATRKQSTEETARIDASLAHLNVLKTMVDGIAQYADQIKIQLHPNDDDRIVGQFTKSAEEPTQRLRKLDDVPEDLKTAITDAIGTAKPALEAGVGQEIGRKVRLLRSAIAQLGQARRMLEGSEASARSRREVEYTIAMQTALMQTELGTTGPDGRPMLEAAASAYESLEAGFPDRLVVPYRHAKVLDALGEAPGAIEKFREVVRRLGLKREPTPKGHWVRAAAPRVLGVILWEEAMRIGRLGTDGGSAGQRKIELLEEAYEVTRQAYGVQIDDERTGGEAQPTERAKAANNLLYYALELSDAQSAAGLPATIDEAKLRAYLADIGAEDPSKLQDFRFLDTSVRAYRHLGEPALEIAAARSLVARAASLAAGGWVPNSLDEASLARAQEVVDRN